VNPPDSFLCFLPLSYQIPRPSALDAESPSFLQSVYFSRCFDLFLCLFGERP